MQEKRLYGMARVKLTLPPRSYRVESLMDSGKYDMHMLELLTL